MHVHILGICGTFMGGIAALAKSLGYRVTGCDSHVYPPMSTMLRNQGIEIIEGYEAEQLTTPPDLIICGNAMKRGIPVVEEMLRRGLPYTSGPEWLRNHVLQGRHVLAISGTHGKTTTTSMLTRILEQAGLEPGFLIGGVARDFGISARLGKTPYFVIEADEYDTAFFDKRSKFVHYRPRTLIINNLEFDHADIFANLAEIQRQFHHLVRTIPDNGLIIYPADTQSIDDTIKMGCWTPTEQIDTQHGWHYQLQSSDGGNFTVFWQGQEQGEIKWSQTGLHNVHNAIAAIAAARHIGIEPAVAINALNQFGGVARRMELVGVVNGISVYDDFAHHPTAIATTLNGLRQHVGKARIIALLEPRSNTMRMGIMHDQLADSLAIADQVLLFAPPSLDWDAQAALQKLGDKAQVFSDFETLLAHLTQLTQSGDHVLIMSNGGFGGIHQRLLKNLTEAITNSH